MAIESSVTSTIQPLIINNADNPTPLITNNVIDQIPIKLSQTDYCTWHMQFNTILIGYDLLGYVDDSHPCTSLTVTTTIGSFPNPAFSLWVWQDQLIFNAIIGSISPNLIPFIAIAKTSMDA